MFECMTGHGLLLNVRRFRSEDAAAAARLFHDTVHRAAGPAYDASQRTAWSAAVAEPEVWQRKLSSMFTLVAEDDAGLAGFMSMTDTGFVDLAYVRADLIGRGVAHALYEAIEAQARQRGLRRLHAQASDLGRRFFLRQGWRVLHEKSVCRRGKNLPCAEMEKRLQEERKGQKA